jgi:hypothetical protein
MKKAISDKNLKQVLAVLRDYFNDRDDANNISMSEADVEQALFDTRWLSGISKLSIDLLSPAMTVNAGMYTAFVCRVHFLTTVENTILRINGGVIKLQQTETYLTSQLGVGRLDVPILTVKNFNVSFDPNTFYVTRNSATDIDIEQQVATVGGHFIDIMFMDTDINIPNGQPATQVWANLSYAGESVGSAFIVDYDHGYDYSGNDTTTPWTNVIPPPTTDPEPDPEPIPGTSFETAILLGTSTDWDNSVNNVSVTTAGNGVVFCKVTGSCVGWYDWVTVNFTDRYVTLEIFNADKTVVTNKQYVVDTTTTAGCMYEPAESLIYYKISCFSDSAKTIPADTTFTITVVAD